MGFLKKVRVMESAIAGKGVFAAEYISKGECIWEITPENSSEVTLELLHHTERTQSPKVFSELLMHTFVEPTLQRMFRLHDEERFKNHAENPNTATFNTRVYALSDIGIGAELTENYFTFGAFPPEVQRLFDQYGVWTVFSSVAATG